MVLISRKLGKYAILWIFPIKAFVRYHDWGQNIENFHVKALNGRRPSLENWLKCDICLISLISLKSGDLIKIDNFSCNDTERYSSFEI